MISRPGLAILGARTRLVEGECAMPRFIFEANIAHYKERLSQETDPIKKETLRRLLAEEEAKLADFNTSSHPSQRAAE